MGKLRILIFLSLFVFVNSYAKSRTLHGESSKSALFFNDPLVVDSAFRDDYRTDLSYIYQELEDLRSCEIKIKGKKLKTTMASRPTFISMFRKKEKRKYVILFNNDPHFKGVFLKNVPEEARVGLFAHELMHVRDYQQLKFGGLMKRGWQYMSKRGKMNLEHRIDSMTIAAGYGEGLFFWSYYVLYNSGASDEYKMFKRETYLTPKDILDRIEDAGFVDVHSIELN